ncbi:MAG: hypothetical protein V1873_05365 [Verrucomicrobiota bacterium]
MTDRLFPGVKGFVAAPPELLHGQQGVVLGILDDQNSERRCHAE